MSVYQALIRRLNPECIGSRGLESWELKLVRYTRGGNYGRMNGHLEACLTTRVMPIQPAFISYELGR